MFNSRCIKNYLQFHYNIGEKRDTLIAFENGFHGDTFGAMSVSGLSVYNGPFEDHFLNVIRIPTPSDTNLEAVLQLLKRTIAENNCAAFENVTESTLIFWYMLSALA